MKKGLLVALLLIGRLCAQEGHWEGAIKQEGQDTLFSVDLAAAPEWTGSFTLPGHESAPPLALVDIQVDARAVRFHIHELPGDPAFSGMLGENGDSIKGTLTQSGRTVTFDMRRTGPARVRTIPPNTALDPRFLGDWAGAIHAADDLRIVLHLSMDESGVAAGMLDTADGRARNLLLSAIHQDGSSIAFDVRLIGGSFRGVISSDGSRIEGNWTQAGATYPAILVRRPK